MFHWTDIFYERVESFHHKNICSQMRNSHLSTFDWQKIFVCSRQVNRSIDVFSSPIRIKDKFHGEIGGRVWCAAENFTVIILLGTILQAQIHIDFQRQNRLKRAKCFFSKSKHVFFLLSNIFIRKEETDWKDLFISTQRHRSKNCWRRRNPIKWKFPQYEENFTSFQEKIHSLRIEMTTTNAQFNGQFNRSRLKIQIEVKTEEKQTFASENLQNMKKISQVEKRKFTQFDFKWQVKMQNLTMNSTEVD